MTKYLSKNNLMDGIIVVQLILVLIIGWQIVDLNKKINVTALGPGQAVETASTEPQPVAQATDFEYQVTDQDHTIGPADAKVTIVEFSDFECPFCGRSYPVVKQILTDYQDQVRFVYKHYPLGFHPLAQPAAEASECAGEQGKFWEYHDQIFENQSLMTSENLRQWAKDLGLNSSQFNRCLDLATYADKVKADLALGNANDVSGTPAFFINNMLVAGSYPYEAMKQVIDQELSK
ncbi:MAG TPA: thioredoxin domain-containing protein [Patescibacteria group bacterium]